MPDLSLIRSLLFTPADRPDRFCHGPRSGADGVILDLEDGVGLPAKPAARKAALAFFADPAPAPNGFVWALRLNHVTAQAGLEDLLALRGASKPAVVVLPKTESVTEIEVALAHLSTDGQAPTIVALIESGRGLAAADEIARHPAVRALAFGAGDLAADLHATLAWEPMLFATMAFSFLPYIVPFSITIAEAAAPPSSLSFLFWGAGVVVLPITLLYTMAVYLVFKGKTAALGEYLTL
jgi:(S)-citramalyl-CoA lyase